ncbi:MAG: DUF3990 domain-containing protein [Coriobacteriales bacterium]|nr:DUF3990 domain-containing protein [Coriobacteriales bacterium]
MTQTLYHGSTSLVESPNTSQSNPSNDFGSGFYTTPNRDEAREWARRKAAYQGRPGYLNAYELAFDSGLTFYKFDREALSDLLWLNFILKNRGYDDFIPLGYDFSMLSKDILIGPIANNKLAVQMNMLTSGLIEGDTLDEVKLRFIGLLSPSRLDNQFCFKNNFATAHLKFRGAERVDE